MMLAVAFVVALIHGTSSHAATAREPAIAVAGKVLRAGIVPLHPAEPGGGAATVAAFLAARGQDPATLASLKMEREIPLGADGGIAVVFAQRIDGLAVYGAGARAIFDGAGHLVALAHNLVPARRDVPDAAIGARAALDAALAAVHPGDGARLSERGRLGNTTSFTGSAFFFRDPSVTRIAIPMPGGALQAGFLVETWTTADNQLDHVIVGGGGRVLHVEHLTVNDRYNVFPENPDVTIQTVVSGPGAGNAASPDGWLGTGVQASIDMSGPNVHAYLDRNNDNAPDAGGDLVGTGDFLAVADLAADPTTEDNQAVAVQNLFYLSNIVHDALFEHGFDEAAGQFQNDDPVLAEAQDGGGFNNANFAPTPDGVSPRMQMYLWNLNGVSPDRDGDLDADIVWHEIGHGLTWRIVDKMLGLMGGAIGEGASDTLAIIEFDDDTVGEYAFNDPNGIRMAPYDGYLEATGRTYEDFFNQVHADGEIYAAIMWDMWTRYRDDPDGAISGPSKAQILDDIVGGMKHTVYAVRPTFPAMRDGILHQISGNADPFTAPLDENLKNRWCYVWRAFARYGVGVSQTTTVRVVLFFLVWDWQEAFDLPPACLGAGENVPPVASFDSVCTALDCDFSDTSSDFDGTVVSWFWEFGDGETSEEQHPSHSYAAADTYKVTLTVTDNDGDSDSVSDDVIVAEPSPEMHVGDLDGSNSEAGFWRRWAAFVTITIHDASENPVEGAVVSGSWIEGASGDRTCTTDAAGQCSVQRRFIKGSSASVTFAVTGVEHATFSYQPEANHDPDGDGNGAEIVIAQPSTITAARP